MYSDSADVKSVLSSPSFHELFTGNVKFKCPNGAYTLTVVLAVVPNKKGYLFTQNNRYEDENRQIHYDKEDIISRCPMVDVMVVRSFAVDELDSEHLGYCHYSAHAIVGEGGFGCAVVYKRHSCEARIPEEVQAMMPMNMVLKFVLNPKEDEDIMLNEIKSMDTLQLEDCPWTVPNLGDVYATPSVITMPYYSATLSDLIPYMTGRCDRVLATYFLAQLIVAVHRIHRSEVVHMDLKPDNIFISDTGHIVVGDMGISRCNVGPGTKIFASDVIGTPPYAAPEVAFGNKFGQEADWYSVGIIAYQLFVGECDAHPFEEPLRDNGEIQVLKPLHKLSHPEGEFIKGMLESDVTQRMTFEKMKNHDIFKHFYLNLREIETRRGSDIVRALLRKYLQA
ncbi:kinase-like domain-containing protein [Cyathus striatus]|nr:kinase-like domain-containing protein [Cyathus striatus]